MKQTENPSNTIGYMVRTTDNLPGDISQRLFVKNDNLTIDPQYTILDESLIRFKDAEQNFVGDNDERIKTRQLIEQNENTEKKLLNDIRNLKHNIRKLEENKNKCDYIIEHNKDNHQKILQPSSSFEFFPIAAFGSPPCFLWKLS